MNDRNSLPSGSSQTSQPKNPHQTLAIIDHDVPFLPESPASSPKNSYHEYSFPPPFPFPSSSPSSKQSSPSSTPLQTTSPRPDDSLAIRDKQVTDTPQFLAVSEAVLQEKKALSYPFSPSSKQSSPSSSSLQTRSPLSSLPIAHFQSEELTAAQDTQVTNQNQAPLASEPVHQQEEMTAAARAFLPSLPQTVNPDNSFLINEILRIFDDEHRDPYNLNQNKVEPTTSLNQPALASSTGSDSTNIRQKDPHKLLETKTNKVPDKNPRVPLNAYNPQRDNSSGVDPMDSRKGQQTTNVPQKSVKERISIMEISAVPPRFPTISDSKMDSTPQDLQSGSKLYIKPDKNIGTVSSTTKYDLGNTEHRPDFMIERNSPAMLTKEFYEWTQKQNPNYRGRNIVSLGGHYDDPLIQTGGSTLSDSKKIDKDSSQRVVQIHDISKSLGSDAQAASHHYSNPENPQQTPNIPVIFHENQAKFSSNSSNKHAEDHQSKQNQTSALEASSLPIIQSLPGRYGHRNHAGVQGYYYSHSRPSIKQSQTTLNPVQDIYFSNENQPQVQASSLYDYVLAEYQDCTDYSVDESLYETLFTWPEQDTLHKMVFLVGSFDDWTHHHPMRHMRKKTPVKSTPHSPADTQTKWMFILSLRPGVYQYKFLVDNQWRCNPYSETQYDIQGSLNNVVKIGPLADVEFRWYSLAEAFSIDQQQGSPANSTNRVGLKRLYPVSKVQLCGSWSSWAQLHDLESHSSSSPENHIQMHDVVYHNWKTTIQLPSGVYYYKFKVDGQWLYDSTSDICVDKFQNINNVLVVPKQ